MNRLLIMFPVLNQFRRFYDDDGRGDHDFTEQEVRLQHARTEVVNATTELIRSSERLNNAALRAFPIEGEVH